jgi:hypothetical protein
MLETTTTNQFLDTESNLWKDLSDEQSQSISGGLSITPPASNPITAYPPLTTPGILSPQPQNPPFKIPSTKG